MHTPTAEDDLQSLVKLAHACSHNQGTPGESVEDEFFQNEIMESSFWTQCDDAAKRRDYTVLGQLFSSL
jgi:hypothetical protein